VKSPVSIGYNTCNETNYEPKKGAFQVSKKRIKKYIKILEKSKQKIEKRLERKQYEDQADPIMTGSNIHYEMSEKVGAISCGGIGAFHQLVEKIGLDKEINNSLELLRRHLPYHESDHVLNITYNVLAGGIRLEDIELRRNDESFLSSLGADRIPDPTTAGDFTRRFCPEDIETLMECINVSRHRVWGESSQEFEEAYIDIDGTLAPTSGECKRGMDISYKGIWGYHPLLISLGNTKEVLYLVNRPGNVVSHQDCAPWIDKAIALLKPFSKKICLRGDTDFSLTQYFDQWSEDADFVFGMDARSGLVERAVNLPDDAWVELVRKEKYTVKTQARLKPENIKEEIVRERGYKNIRLESEDVAEFEYSPTKCKESYRMVVVRKNLSVEKGEDRLFDEIRYFFYITTRRDISSDQVVRLANERCDQENVIEQLKNGVNAMRMPVRDLHSNWAYMVMASLAWNLKSWYGLLMPSRERGKQVVKMEFRRFLQSFILLPCQIIKTGRKIVYRLLCYNDWLIDFFATWERIRQLKFS